MHDCKFGIYKRCTIQLNDEDKQRFNPYAYHVFFTGDLNIMYKEPEEKINRWINEANYDYHEYGDENEGAECGDYGDSEDYG